MKLFEELRLSKFWVGVWPDVNTIFSLAGKTLENLTAELLTHTVHKAMNHRVYVSKFGRYSEKFFTLYSRRIIYKGHVIAQQSSSALMIGVRGSQET